MKFCVLGRVDLYCIVGFHCVGLLAGLPLGLLFSTKILRNSVVILPKYFNADICCYIENREQLFSLHGRRFHRFTKGNRPVFAKKTLEMNSTNRSNLLWN